MLSGTSGNIMLAAAGLLDRLAITLIELLACSISLERCVLI
jgi:hypothetical protein